jgi:multidrug efflux system outer membrane protein
MMIPSSICWINRALQNSPTMQAARLRISQSQSTVELAQSAMGVQATAVAAQNRLRVTNKQLPGPTPSPCRWIKTALVYAEYGRRRSDAEYRSLGSRPRPRRRRDWRKECPPAETAGIELDLASSVAQLYFAMQATFQKIELLNQLEAIARLSVQAHEHRTARGVEDSVDVANAQAELLAARSR